MLNHTRCRGDRRSSICRRCRTVNGQTYNQTVALESSETTDIRGAITVDPAHVGQKAELIVAAIYTLATGQQALFSLTKFAEGTVTPMTWDGSIEGLSVFENTTLSDNQAVKRCSTQLHCLLLCHPSIRPNCH